MKRREFLMTIGGTLIAIPAAVTVAGCGGGDDDDDDTGGADAASGPTSFEGTNSGDSSGHSHMFTVLCADLEKSTVTYSATGSGHTHTITLDGTQLSALAAGTQVNFDTSDSHPHSWSVAKPSNAC